MNQENTVKGSAEAISDILTGKTIAAIEGRLRAEKSVDDADTRLNESRKKFWDASDALSIAQGELSYFKQDRERLEQMVREGNETINDLRAQLREQESKNIVDLTPDMLAKLAEARENVFQNLMADVTFPDNKPKPRTLGELLSFYVFPIFEAGNKYSSAIGSKIAMIKVVRDLTGAGLKDAKGFIEGVGTGKL